MAVELAKKETEIEMMKTTKDQLHDMGVLLAEAQARHLNKENQESMDHITQPLKQAISEMRKAISDNTKDHTAQTASLKEQLRLMMETGREMSEKAEGLANVLRRDNKISGNMGEIILGDLLTSQGLTEGIHYEVQARLRDEMGRPLRNDETGREMQPDVILHYPQGQDAVIDSKVSLVAYQRYVNAETPEEKERALQEHIKSIRSHVNELSRKDYSKYIKVPREAIDFVIMFVPFESSLQLALANDPTLWRDAFERKVFVTGEQNLLGILHMIHIAWVQNQQAENQQKVFGIAEQLLDRLGDFIQRYNKLGEHIELVRKDFDAAGNKLFTGRQSVVQKGRELIDLGGKENPNRRIPKAEMSIAEISDNSEYSENSDNSDNSENSENSEDDLPERRHSRL
jgi:DNA recombination protein RmuC